jgi:hypothetical protein
VVSPPGDTVGAQVRVFVQTRGAARATDYAFLGGAPAQPWWRAYRDATAFDHPTVLVTSDGERWAAYLSGIPSARVDAVGTVVRYTLVLDGPCGAADSGCVPAAVAAWLDDVAVGAGPGHLSTALDARFPPDDVQRWLAVHVPADHAAPVGSPPVPTDDRHRRRRGSDESAVRQADGPESATGSGGPVAAEVRGRALAALAALPAPPAVADVPGDAIGDWIGAVAAPGSRAAFTARVAALVGGDTGRALLLNLVGGPDDAGPLLDPASPVAVLVETTDPHLARPTALRPVVEAKKASAPPARVAAATGMAMVPLAAPVVLTALVLTALVVTVLVLLL